MLVRNIPGYLEAVAQEQLVRDAALVTERERILDFEVVPMTLRHYIVLRLAESPLIPPFRIPEWVQLVQFLWVLNPGFSLDERKRRAFVKRCRCLQELRQPFLKTEMRLALWRIKSDARDNHFAHTVKAAMEYVKEAMQDRPPSVQGGIQGPDYYSDGVAAVATLAREFGWIQSEVLSLPLKVMFQYLKEIREHFAAVNGVTLPSGNPSDRIKNEFLKQRNAALQKN